MVGLGKLGRGVIEACEREGGLVLLTASRAGGWRVDGVPEVIVDASGPSAHEDVVRYCRDHGTALIECVSNLAPEQLAALATLAELVPVVRATNLTLGHYLQARLLACCAATGVTAGDAGPDPVETSVHERHPAAKAHRPSATAAKLAGLWRAATGTGVVEVSSRRAGGPVSDHEVLWSWPAESLLLRHSVTRIDAAAAGALAAARWTAGRGPGPAQMDDVYDDLARAARSQPE